MATGGWLSSELGGGGGGGSTWANRGSGSLTGPGPTSQPKSSWPTGSDGASTGFSEGLDARDRTVAQMSGQGIGRPTPNVASWLQQAGAATRSAASSMLAQQAVGGIPSPTSLLAPTALANAFYGPQQTLLDQQLARQYDQLGMIQPDIDYRKGALQRDTDLAREGLDIDRARVGVDTKLTTGQQANLDRLRAILGKQYGLQGEALDNTLAQLGIDEAKLRDMAKRQTFDLRSNLTARGAFSTIANERGTGRIDRDLVYGLGGINNQRTAADIANRGNLLGLDEKGIGYDNQELGLQARLANNGLDLQQIGLNEEKLTNSLNDGLRQIGLEGMVSINGLLDAIGGTNAQQAQLATTILGQILGYADLPPETLAQLAAAMGISLDTTPTTGQAGKSARLGQ